MFMARLAMPYNKYFCLARSGSILKASFAVQARRTSRPFDQEPFAFTPDGISELHKQGYGHMTTGQSAKSKEFPCFNIMPRRYMPLLAQDLSPLKNTDGFLGGGETTYIYIYIYHISYIICIYLSLSLYIYIYI